MNASGRILIVEDDYFIANDLAQGFQKAGLDIAGPVQSLAKALALVEAGGIGGAVLDVNLDGQKVFDVADALIARDIPVIFVTGYEKTSLPARYSDIPLCLKPVSSDLVIKALDAASR